MPEVQITIESLMKNRPIVIAVDPTSLLAADTVGNNGVHPCLYPLHHRKEAIELITALMNKGILVLTPTLYSNPLNVEFALGLEGMAFHLNLESARLTRKAVGKGFPIGGLMSIELGLELIGPRRDISERQIIRAFAEQAEALVIGGVNYLVLTGIKNSDILRRIINGIRFSASCPNSNNSKIIFTLPIEEACRIQDGSEIPTLVKIVQETGNVLAAGVTLDFAELSDSLERIRKLSVQLGNIPVIVMLEGNYRYADNGREIVPTLDVVQIQTAIEKLKGCEVSIVGFTHGVTLKLVQELSRHQVPLPEAT